MDNTCTCEALINNAVVQQPAIVLYCYSETVQITRKTLLIFIKKKNGDML